MEYKLLLIGIGTLHDLSSVWFPTSSMLWRTCEMLDSDKTSRPDIVADIKHLVIDLPHCKYSVIMSVYGAHGYLFDEMGNVNSSACKNIANMLKSSGVFVCFFTETTQRVFTGAKSRDYESRKHVIDNFIKQVITVEPSFRPITPKSEKRVFIQPFASTFFHTSDRRDVMNRLSDSIQECVLFQKK